MSNTGSPCISVLCVHPSQATFIDISLHIFRSCLPRPSLLSSAGYRKVCDRFDTGRGPLYMAILSDIEQSSIVLYPCLHLIFISEHKLTSILVCTVLTNNVLVCVVHHHHLGCCGEFLFLCLRLCQPDDMLYHARQCRQSLPPWSPTCSSLYRGSDWWSHTPRGAVWPTH